MHNKLEAGKKYEDIFASHRHLSKLKLLISLSNAKHKIKLFYLCL